MAINITITAERYAELVGDAYEAGYKAAAAAVAVSSLSVTADKLKKHILDRCEKAARRKYGRAYKQKWS